MNNKRASHSLCLYLALVLAQLRNSYKGINSEKRDEKCPKRSHKISKYTNDIGNPYDRRALVPMGYKNGMVGTPAPGMGIIDRTVAHIVLPFLSRGDIHLGL